VLYQDAILEFDNARLPKRILQARSAIRDRAQEILADPSERQLLDNALQTLAFCSAAAFLTEADSGCSTAVSCTFRNPSRKRRMASMN